MYQIKIKKFLKRLDINICLTTLSERKQGFSFPLIDILKGDKEKEKIENILTSKAVSLKKWNQNVINKGKFQN